MSSFNRAFSSITKKKGKSLLLGLVIFFAAALELCGLAFLETEAEQSADLRGATGTSFTVERADIWGNAEEGNSDGSSMSNTADLISKEMVEKISGIQGIKGHDALYETVLQIFDRNKNPCASGSNAGGIPNQFRSYGSIDSQYNSLFLANKLALAKGRHLTKNDKKSILISSDAAEMNGLKVGDKIQAVCDPESNDPFVELEIIGIYDVIADQEDVKDQWSMDAWFNYSSYAFVSMDTLEDLMINYQTDGPNKGYLSADFFVNDPEQLERIMAKVQKLGGIDWKNYRLKANDQVYERTEDSMSNISSLIKTLIIVIAGVSMCIVTLILFMWMKSRVRETGILLAAGVTKASILMQCIFEAGMIALVCFPLSYLFSRMAAGFAGSVFGITNNVIVTAGHFGIVCGSGMVLLIVAILISCIPMLRLNPKDILSRMS